ncbi:MAG: hypothetical protein NT069_27820, partial [Planctomycetota bacterium]|nr:hypothetical protein [Planctomycetota bacterium]
TLLGENWGEGWCHWRRLLRDAYQESTSDADGMPAETSGDMEEWRLLIDCLVDTVLWDTDYLCEDAYVDQSPEAGQLMKDQMGVPDEYFTAVAPDPTDRDLDIARQNIRALIDG